MKNNGIVYDPIYLQLCQLLKRHAETLPEGTKFPSERALAAQYGVSRITVNKALAALVGEGILEFRKGVGTFVQKRKLQYELGQLISFTRYMENLGKVPQTKVKCFCSPSENTLPPDWARDEIQNSLFYYIERIREVDQNPVIYEERCLNAECLQSYQVTIHDLQGSLYQFLSEKMKLAPVKYVQTIRAAMIPTHIGKELKVEQDQVALVVLGKAYLLDGQWLWYERTWYRADWYEFYHEIGIDGVHSSPLPRFGECNPISKDLRIGSPKNHNLKK